MRRLICLIAMLVLLCVTAQAVQVSTAVGSGADTYLSNDSQHSPGTNHGSKTYMNVRTAWGIRFRAAYMKFDLSGISGDTSGATLSVDVTSATRSRTLSVFALADGLDGWDESSVTYNTAPGFIPNPPTPLGQYATDANLVKVADLVLTQGGTGWYSSTAFTATPGTDDLLTLAIIFETESTDTNPDFYFSSKESSPDLAPVLNMPNAVPEPATIALLGFGAAVLARRKK